MSAVADQDGLPRPRLTVHSSAPARDAMALPAPLWGTERVRRPSRGSSARHLTGTAVCDLQRQTHGFGQLRCLARAGSRLQWVRPGTRWVLHRDRPRLRHRDQAPPAPQLNSRRRHRRRGDHSQASRSHARSARSLPGSVVLQAPIPVYAADGVRERLAGLEEDDLAAIDQVFTWRPLPAGQYQLGPFRLDSWALPHFVPNAGVRFSAGDLTVAYTGDTGPDAALVELARDADLFIAEATDRQRHRISLAGQRMHLTSREAGELPAMPVSDGSCSLTSGPTPTDSPLRLRPAKPSTERFCSLTRAWRSTCTDAKPLAMLMPKERPAGHRPTDDPLADAVVNLDSSRVQDLGVDPEARCYPEVLHSGSVVPGQSAQRLPVDWRSRSVVQPRDDATWGGETTRRTTSPTRSSWPGSGSRGASRTKLGLNRDASKAGARAVARAAQVPLWSTGAQRRSPRTGHLAERLTSVIISWPGSRHSSAPAPVPRRRATGGATWPASGPPGGVAPNAPGAG